MFFDQACSGLEDQHPHDCTTLMKGTSLLIITIRSSGRPYKMYGMWLEYAVVVRRYGI